MQRKQGILYFIPTTSHYLGTNKPCNYGFRVLLLSELLATRSSMKADTDTQALTSGMEAQTSPSAWTEDHLPVTTVAVHRRFPHLPTLQKHAVAPPKFRQQPKKISCASSFPSAARCHYWLYMLVPSKADNFPLLSHLQLACKSAPPMPTQALKSRSTSLCSLLPVHAK